jgi:hypothetical protein
MIISYMRIKDSDYVWDRPALHVSKLRPADPLAAPEWNSRSTALTGSHRSFARLNN